jgi:hypothetical protein
MILSCLRPHYLLHCFPNLSRMALDVLSIPAMSAAPERLFSSSNITISDRRNRIDIDTVEAIECIKSWRKLKSFNTEGSDGEVATVR